MSHLPSNLYTSGLIYYARFATYNTALEAKDSDDARESGDSAMQDLLQAIAASITLATIHENKVSTLVLLSWSKLKHESRDQSTTQSVPFNIAFKTAAAAYQS